MGMVYISIANEARGMTESRHHDRGSICYYKSRPDWGRLGIGGETVAYKVVTIVCTVGKL